MHTAYRYLRWFMGCCTMEVEALFNTRINILSHGSAAIYVLFL